MKALQFMSPNTMAVNEIAIPKIADDEVLLASRSVGICHSDIELLEGRYIIPFQYPIVPFQINSYGSDVIRTRGRSRAFLFDSIDLDGMPDPPAPSNKMCMDLGEKLAKIILESDYKVALIASASWSHASLSSNSENTIPDHDSDKKLLNSLLQGDYDYWRDLSRQTIENAGQHEILNWMPLIGAMSFLNKKPVLQDYVDTYLFQANKVFVSFE